MGFFVSGEIGVFLIISGKEKKKEEENIEQL
jgi:hypothetical protein